MCGMNHTVDDLKQQIAEYEHKTLELKAEYEQLSRRLQEIVDELEAIDEQMMLAIRELLRLKLQEKEVNEK